MQISKAISKERPEICKMKGGDNEPQQNEKLISKKR